MVKWRRCRQRSTAERAVPRDGWSTSVEAFRNDFVRDSTKRGIWLLLGAVSFLFAHRMRQRRESGYFAPSAC